ncbi:YncE family protein [Streptomyces sp. H10-C2]|uniref:YncE family protein n=1 Tax=unclassified Streptomyces TaxID=2593676 RepID=UPI0024B9E297|nr:MULTISPECIES: YncE family protein [unclassified Streptomyces]MDJ0345672.1 YncE family protein [Streptomyces sp. PH10-H1]MDJ0374524.1 YncE family protein [Streptomyces sp. H10-C2]
MCTAPAGAGTSPSDPLKEVLFVGNNWDGTADVVRSTGTFAKIGHLNVIPDKNLRLAEIYLNPVRLAVYLAIQQGPGEGHDQYVDDMYTTPDGKAVVVSRPSFGDVVSLDLATGRVNWRYEVAGYRADHMALSPDGRRVVVSASLANSAYVIDIQTGRQLGSFQTGDKPHENVFTDDGKYLWNMSIGEVQTGLDDPLWDWTKGDRHITVVDGATYKPIRTIDMRARLNAFGRSDLSNSVRPVAFSPDWSKLYFQVSFFNGFVEYSVATDKITRVKTLPENPATNPDRTTWPNDSRDHGLSMSPDGSKLCVAGTVDDYATVIDRTTLQEGPIIPASKPYWATVSGDGKYCIISESGANQITAIDFATGQKVLSVPVGYHPQRVRLGHVATDWTGPAAG